MLRTEVKLAFVLSAFVRFSIAADIYVSPDGSDSGDGSIGSPLASIQDAVDAAAAGDTIYLRAGTFSPSTNIQITETSGTSSNPITVTAYNNEKVIIDGEALTGTPAEVGGSLDNSDRGIFHIQDVSYWQFINLELINGPYGIYARDASNNYYERIITHDNYETGFQLEGDSAHNTVLYLDSYMNRDPRKNGESADGFACKEGSGEGNVLRGARLWNNVDDGLDLFEFASPVTVEDTISWGNGFNRWGFDPFEGDGNGYKLGIDEADVTGPVNHIVTNCIAFGNAAKGFTDNKQTGDFTMSHNTAWNNGAVGFQITVASATLTDNIAAENNGGDDQVSLTSGDITSSGNSWDSDDDWSNSSFVSVDISLITGERNADGTIDPSDFLAPADGSDIGATVDW